MLDFSPALILLLFRQHERADAEQSLRLLDAFQCVVAEALGTKDKSRPTQTLREYLLGVIQPEPTAAPEPSPQDLVNNRLRLMQRLVRAGAVMSS